ncbi:hypothetical protein C1H46_002249 [Malus baccata]|uniref:Uncharacterized protein n=1 Tax=Malus baccata TaxID=106549 RepID=A0A540NMD1_MALBA|nr:hypothetical protein C1H46_002249 [Malus baccata]
MAGGNKGTLKRVYLLDPGVSGNCLCFLEPVVVKNDLEADITDLDDQQNLLPLSYEIRYKYPSCPYKVGVSIDPYNYDAQDHIIDHTVSVMTSTLLES